MAKGSRTFGQFVGDLARSFFRVLGEVAERVDALSLEDKQEVKDGIIALLSASGKPTETIKLLTKQDEELRRVLSDRGWWVLQKDINGPVKRELLRIGREKADQIDAFLCALFNENDGARLKAKTET